MSQYTMDHTVDTVEDAVAGDLCRHCGNARNDGTPAPDLCTECGRCHSDIRACKDSPNCVVRSPGYAGAESLVRMQAPVVSSITPANGATGVSVNTSVSVTWNVPINPDTLDWVDPGPIYLIPVDGAAVPVFAVLVISWSANGKTATVTPTAPLEHNKIYKVIVGAGGFATQSIEGLPMVDSYDQPDGFTTAP